MTALLIRPGQPKLILSAIDVAEKLRLQGFPDATLATWVAIAYAETGGTLDAHSVGDVNLTELGEESIGLFQINFRPSRDAELINGIIVPKPSSDSRWPAANMIPEINIKNAYAISGGGRKMTPWSTYKNGDYKAYLTKARVAASAVLGTGSSTPISTDTGATSSTATVVYDTPEPLGPVLTLRVGYSTPASEVEAHLVGGSVKYSTDGVSEVQLELEDQDLALQRRYQISVGSPVDFDGRRWETVEFEIRPGPAGPHLRLYCHPLGAVRMRTTTSAARTNISPTDFMRAAAARAGLHFLGEQSARRGSVGPTTISDRLAGVTLMRQQNDWEVGTALAGELGYLAFEARGTYYFGSPLYLSEQGATTQLSWDGYTYPGAGTVMTPTQVPRCRAARRYYHRWAPGHVQDQLQGISVQASVPREQGVLARVGMRLALAGVPPFQTVGLLLNGVSYSLDDRTSTVTISAMSADALPASNRTAADVAASNGSNPLFGTPSSNYPSADQGQGARIGTAERERLFGQPGDRARTSSYITPWGMHVTVNNLVLTRFRAACEDAHAHSSWRPRRIDSYAVRAIRGSSDWSLHSFGLAWDFFSTSPGVTPPGGVYSSLAAPAPDFRAIFKRHGFYLGAEFHNRKDYPHIEWASTPPARGT